MSIDNCNTLYVTLHLASKTYSCCDETWCRSSCRRRYGHCSWCPWCWCAVGDDGCLEVVVAMFLLTCSSIQHMTHRWDLIINKFSVASATNFRADCYLGQRLVPICGNDIMHCLYRAQSWTGPHQYGGRVKVHSTILLLLFLVLIWPTDFSGPAPDRVGFPAGLNGITFGNNLRRICYGQVASPVPVA